MIHDLKTNIERVFDRIGQAAARAGRDPHDVLLIGVTKTHPVELVRAVFELGLEDLGENRVQELVDKRSQLPQARWHLIGRLQRNKVRDVVDGQVLVHSVDRPRLVDALEHRAARQGVVQRVLVQVNVGDDPAKGGCEVERTDELVAYAHEQPHLRVEGLMTMPPLAPQDADPGEAARRHFVTLRELRDVIAPQFPAVRELSMGMTVDFEAAVEEGSTMVRVGTAIFGARPGPAGAQRKEG